MNCPRCKLPVGGRTFGNEKAEYDLILRKAWNDGTIASWQNPDLIEQDGTYDNHEDPALYRAWAGGLYYGKLRRLENPEKVAEWLAKATHDPKMEEPKQLRA